MEQFNLRYLKPQGFIILCGILFIGLYLSNKYISSHWGVSVSIFAIGSGIFGFINNKLWNKRPFKRMYWATDFSGKYEGMLEYEYFNEKAEKVSGKMTHIKVIRQNGSHIVVRSWTKKEDGSISSPSKSLVANIVKDEDGTYSLIYNYRNEGCSELGYSPHYGTEVLELLKDSDGTHLIGKYYTERLPHQTKGRINLTLTSKKLVNEK